jgi:hypothetical protein
MLHRTTVVLHPASKDAACLNRASTLSKLGKICAALQTSDLLAMLSMLWRAASVRIGRKASRFCLASEVRTSGGSVVPNMSE